MATLEKIRSKSVLLIVVIGVALLAFIIGDAITNSRNLFGDHTTVAKVGGEKIDITEYNRQLEELKADYDMARQQSPERLAGFDTQMLSQMALDKLISERLIDKAIDKAGIRTSTSQLAFYILEQPINPRVYEIIQQLNYSGIKATTPAQAHEIIFNPKQNGLTEEQMEPFQNAWVAMEQETEKLIRRHSYETLLLGTIKANDLDKKALYNDYVATSNVNLAFKPYSEYSDAKYSPSDSEIKAEYDKNKGKYKVEEPTKEVAFIAVNIAPSEVDIETATLLAQNTVEALNNNTLAQNKELRKQGIRSVSRKMLEKDIPYNMQRFVTTAPADSVNIIAENIKGFTIVKVGQHKEEVDSLQLNVIQVMGKADVASVFQSLNEGLAIDSVPSKFGAENVNVQEGQWVPLYAAQGPTGAFSNAQIDSLLNSNGQYITLLLSPSQASVLAQYITLQSSPQAPLLVQLAAQSSPKNIYEYEEVTYELKPSSTTVNEVRTKLEDFIASNHSTKQFVQNAPKEGYTVKTLNLNSSMPAVPTMPGMQTYYPDSRQVVRWVMVDGKAGEVSNVYESKDANSPAVYAVAVISEFEDFLPVNNVDVKNELSDKIRKSKKGDELMKQYTPQATSIDNVSTAMGVESRNEPSFRFGNNARVRDAAILGKIAGSKPGKVVLVKGDSGIYAYEILSETTENFPYNEHQYEQQYFQLVHPNLNGMLRGANKVSNNIYKFEQGE